jgi:hypothetical protein
VSSPQILNPNRGYFEIDDTLDFSVTVSNLGPEDSDLFNLDARFSLDLSQDSSDQFLSRIATGLKLKSGDSVTLIRRLTFPTPIPMPQGRRLYFAVGTEPASAIEDLYLDNNVAFTPIFFGSPPYSVSTRPSRALTSIIGLPGTVEILRNVGFVFEDTTRKLTGGLPFALNFYGRALPEGHPVIVSSNGWICFSEDSFSVSPTSFPVNAELPSKPGFDPSNMLALFWEDLKGSLASSRVASRVSGVAPDRRWIVEYRDLSSLNLNGRISAQIEIHESGRIDFRYDSGSTLSGGSATIGLENYLSTDALDPTGLGEFNAGPPTVDYIFLPFNQPPPTQIDLALENFQLSPLQAVYQAGDSVNVTVTARNLNSLSPGAVDLRFVVSSDATIDSSDQVIGLLASGLILAPNESRVLSATFTLPAQLALPVARTSLLALLLDPGDSQQDADLGNNSLVRQILFGAPFYTQSSQGSTPFVSISGQASTTVLVASTSSGFQSRSFSVNTPFTFYYFGQPVLSGATCTISSNGWLLLNDSQFFASPSNVPLPNSNAYLPDSSSLLGVLAVFWDSLVGRTTSGASIMSSVSGHAPSRRWTIEWSNLELAVGSGRLSFQVTFYESSNLIRLNYLEHSPLSGASATIGLNDLFAADGLDVTGLGAINQNVPQSEIFLIPRGSRLPSMVDLAISNFSVSGLSTNSLPGEVIVVSATVSNLGTEASAPFNVDLLLSTDSALDANDQLVGRLADGIRLTPGQSLALSRSFSLPSPSPLSAGRRYSLGLMADPRNVQGDPDLSNNSAQRLIPLGTAPYSISTQPQSSFQSILGMPGTIVFQFSLNFDEVIDNRFLPFAFQFFGNTLAAGSRAQVSSNGWIGFDNSNTSASNIVQSSPSLSAPNAVIALFWADLIGRGAAPSMLAERVDGVPGLRLWTIEYSNIETRVGAGRFSAQVLISEANSEILLRYSTGIALSNTRGFVGLEGPGGIDGIDATGLADLANIPNVDILLQPRAPNNSTAQPNLTLTSVQVSPSRLPRTGYFELTRVFKNAGNGSSLPSELRLVLSNDSNLDDQDQVLAIEQVPALAPGQSLSLSSTYRLDGTQMPGTYSIGIIVNSGSNPVPESDFSDNRFGASVEVIAGRIGDINGDGAVDITDVARCVDRALNAATDPQSDLNGDGQIDILDIMAVVREVLGSP